jgi:hypothetical protein
MQQTQEASVCCHYILLHRYFYNKSSKICKIMVSSNATQDTGDVGDGQRQCCSILPVLIVGATVVYSGVDSSSSSSLVGTRT